MVLGVPIPDFQVITRRILIIVMAIKLLMYERNAFFDKKISTYDKPFNVNQDSQSIEDEQMHLLNGSIHEDINQVLCHPHRKRPHLIAITMFARLQVCNVCSRRQGKEGEAI